MKGDELRSSLSQSLKNTFVDRGVGGTTNLLQSFVVL